MTDAAQFPPAMSPANTSLHLSADDSPRSNLFLPIPPASFGSPTLGGVGAAAPIPISRPVSRGATLSLSRHNSQRHHPYSSASASPASLADQQQLSRPRSATSASDYSEWESEASVATYDLYGSSVDSFCTTPATSCEAPSTAVPSMSTSATVEESPFVVGRPPRIGKGGKPVKSHTRKLEPGHIKRPPNAFILFRSHCCQPDPPSSSSLDPSQPEPPGTAHARHLASLEINNSQHISVIVSQVWKGLSAKDKAYWEDKARVAKEEHQRLHPDYKYRPQQRVRDSSTVKKKRRDMREVNEHREACNEVARQVLEIERERRRRDGVVEDDDGPDSTAPPPPPRQPNKKKKSPRATRASGRANRSKAKAKAPPAPQYPSPEGVFDLELPDHRTTVDSTVFLPPFEAASSRPHTAHILEQASSSAPQHVSTQALLNSPEGQFSYMNQLDALFAHSQPAPLSIDPRLASAPTSRPATALPQQASYEPVFSNPFASPPPSTASQTASTFVLPNPQNPVRPATAAPTASPFHQLQGYTLGGTLPAAPRTANPDVPVSPFDARFVHPERPAPLPIDALKQRRGTLRASTLNAGRGDLMLLQPVTTLYNGRRQSIGWNAGVRRLSATAMAHLGDEAPPTPRAPAFTSSVLATGVLSATKTFETFSFPQALVESLPTEEPDVTAEFFAQFASAVPVTGLFGMEELSENDRPSTADSDWSDVSIERLDFDLPAQYLERRRSTLVPSKFAKALSSVSPPSPSGYHVGSTDFFQPPPSALSTAATSAGASPGPAESSHAYSTAANFSTDVSPGITVNVEDWLSGAAANMHVADQSDARGAALSISQERLLQQQQQPEPHQLLSGMTTSSEPSTDCEYVFLTMEQLQDAELMAKIHRFVSSFPARFE